MYDICRNPEECSACIGNEDGDECNKEASVALGYGEGGSQNLSMGPICPYTSVDRLNQRNSKVTHSHVRRFVDSVTLASALNTV